MDEKNSLSNQIKYSIQNFEVLNDEQISHVETLSEHEKMEIIKTYNQTMQMVLEYLLFDK